MPPDSSRLLCARCRVPAKGITNSDDQIMIVCPNCGESDTLENATREAAQYVVWTPSVEVALCNTFQTQEPILSRDSSRKHALKRGFAAGSASCGS